MAQSEFSSSTLIILLNLQEKKDMPESDEENFEEFQKSVRKMPLNSQWKVEGSLSDASMERIDILSQTGGEA